MQRVKKLFSVGAMLGLVLSLMPVSSIKAEAATDSGMIHFVMRVRWGNVIGEPTSVAMSNFDGSISVSNNARVSLERKLLFEPHNATADKITSQKDPVSWTSLIYNHWDGVKVLVSSPANDSVTITTAEGSITKTAQEFVDESYIVQDVGEGREIVVRIFPVKNPKYFLKVIWGYANRTGYALKETAENDEVVALQPAEQRLLPFYNASGSFAMNGGGTLDLVRTLRFENSDRILPINIDNQIQWVSYVGRGVDGILTKLDLDANSLNKSDTVTLNFTKVTNEAGTEGWSKDFNVVDLYHDKITTETVKGNYGVILQVWRKPNRSLIRIKNRSTVYLVEDGVKQPIPSPEVLASQGMTFNDVEVIEQDEADTYADGEAICYADGSIVREEGTPEVYVIADGEKKHIQDPTSFTDLGYSWNNIVNVKPGVLGLYRNRVALKSNSTHPEGALIREDGNPTVYLIEGGKKKPISSLKMFAARKLDWNKVLVVNKTQVNNFQSGTNMQYPDGSVLRDPAGKVYTIDQGKKRWIRSGDDFTGAGYTAGEVIDISDSTEISDLNTTEEGNDIVADDIS